MFADTISSRAPVLEAYRRRGAQEMGWREESHHLPPSLRLSEASFSAEPNSRAPAISYLQRKAKSYTAVRILRTHNREMAIYVCAILLYNMDHGKGLSLTHNL